MLTDQGRAYMQTKPDWYAATKVYAKSDRRKAIWQLIDTFAPYCVLWGLMIYTVHQGVSYWITLGLAVIASALYIRIFIIFHDCCHGSFFSSPRANKVVGYITGVVTFTPFDDWRLTHATHHLTVGDLDRRGVGDVKTLTVEEYRAASRWKRLTYRLFRSPLILFTVSPAVLFLIVNRFSSKIAGRRERRSVLYTNIAIVAVIGAAGVTMGLKTYILIQLPIIFIAGTFGLWLFYVQHQFQGVYWARHDTWEQIRAALEGSSYYKLPGIVQWVTGNIGLHHVHHVRPTIPNYNLQPCLDHIPALRDVTPITFRKSLKSLFLNLYDENQKKLVSFRALKTLPHDTG